MRDDAFTMAPFATSFDLVKGSSGHLTPALSRGTRWRGACARMTRDSVH